MEALRAWRDHLVEVHRKRDCQGGCPLGSLVGELAEVAPEFRDDLAEGFGKWKGAIREGLRVMQSSGELRRNADLDRLATAFLAAVEGGILLSQLQRDTLPLETALDDVLDRIEALRPKRARVEPSSPSGLMSPIDRCVVAQRWPRLRTPERLHIFPTAASSQRLGGTDGLEKTVGSSKRVEVTGVVMFLSDR